VINERICRQQLASKEASLAKLCFAEKLEIVKVQDFFSEFRGGLSSPPAAAKCVRTILRIQHQLI